MQMEFKIKEAVKHMGNVRVTQGRDYISPTEIGRHIGGPSKHSSFGSPICMKAVAMGLMNRNHAGHYALTSAGIHLFEEINNAID